MKISGILLSISAPVVADDFAMLQGRKNQEESIGMLQPAESQYLHMPDDATHVPDDATHELLTPTELDFHGTSMLLQSVKDRRVVKTGTDAPDTVTGERTGGPGSAILSTTFAPSERDADKANNGGSAHWDADQVVLKSIKDHLASNVARLRAQHHRDIKALDFVEQNFTTCKTISSSADYNGFTASMTTHEKAVKKCFSGADDGGGTGGRKGLYDDMTTKCSAAYSGLVSHETLVTMKESYETALDATTKAANPAGHWDPTSKYMETLKKAESVQQCSVPDVLMNKENSDYSVVSDALEAMARHVKARKNMWEECETAANTFKDDETSGDTVCRQKVGDAEQGFCDGRKKILDVCHDYETCYRDHLFELERQNGIVQSNAADRKTMNYQISILTCMLNAISLEEDKIHDAFEVCRSEAKDAHTNQAYTHDGDGNEHFAIPEKDAPTASYCDASTMATIKKAPGHSDWWMGKDFFDSTYDSCGSNIKTCHLEVMADGTAATSLRTLLSEQGMLAPPPAPAQTVSGIWFVRHSFGWYRRVVQVGNKVDLYYADGSGDGTPGEKAPVGNYYGSWIVKYGLYDCHGEKTGGYLVPENEPDLEYCDGNSGAFPAVGAGFHSETDQKRIYWKLGSHWHKCSNDEPPYNC